MYKQIWEILTPESKLLKESRGDEYVVDHLLVNRYIDEKGFPTLRGINYGAVNTVSVISYTHFNCLETLKRMVEYMYYNATPIEEEIRVYVTEKFMKEALNAKGKVDVRGEVNRKYWILEYLGLELELVEI